MNDILDEEEDENVTPAILEHYELSSALKNMISTGFHEYKLEKTKILGKKSKRKSSKQQAEKNRGELALKYLKQMTDAPIELNHQ